MATILEPQASLEVAVLQALLIGGGPKGLPIPVSQAQRMYDGQPPSTAGNVFYSVWYDGQRTNQGKRTTYEELFGVYVTISVRFTQPFDRWLIHRDDVERRANALKALVVGLDMYNAPITNAAALALAGFQSSGSSTPGPRGWVEALYFEGYDAKVDAGYEWFHAKAPETKDVTASVCGVYQRVRFGKAKRIQAVRNALT